jgi:hypothetical protein
MGGEEGRNGLDGVLQTLALVDESVGNQHRGGGGRERALGEELGRKGRDTVGDNLHTATKSKEGSEGDREWGRETCRGLCGEHQWSSSWSLSSPRCDVRAEPPNEQVRSGQLKMGGVGIGIYWTCCVRACF